MADPRETRRLFRLPIRSRRDIDQELREEIDAHIEMGVDALVAQGVDPETAEREVRARLSDLERDMPVLVTSARRRTRVKNRHVGLRSLGRDAAYALRQMRRSPLFVVGVVLSLGFGIGASATVYSWMQSMLLEPLPEVREANRLVTVRPDASHGFGFSLPEFEAWRDAAGSFSSMAAVSLSMFAVSADSVRTENQGALVYGMFVTPNYFEVLGVDAARGRHFAEADGKPGAEAVAVISDAAWRRQFEARSDVIGKTVLVNGYPVRIIGVAPPRFWGNLTMARFDLWVPLSTRPWLIPSDATTWQLRETRWLDGIARLASDVTMKQADAEMRVISARDAETFSESRGRFATVIPLDVGGADLLRPLFMAVSSVMFLVVLLICANVANLLLTRAAGRQHEMAVRLSLGATRARLVGQLLTESTLLAIAGAAVGVLLSSFGEHILAALTPPTSIPLGASFEADLQFLLFVSALTATCVVAFGLAPALIGSRVDYIAGLKVGGRGSATSRRRARGTLVVVQYAFALATLVCAVVVLKRDRNVRHIDLGFRHGDAVLLAQTEISLAGERDLSRWAQDVESAVGEIAAIPGVEASAVASFVPLGLMPSRREVVVVPSAISTSEQSVRVLTNSVDEGYFALMGIPVLQGRGVSADDGAGRTEVVVVNEAFADRYFAGQLVVGRHFQLGTRDVTVVGVVRNGRYDFRNIDDASIPMIYRSWRQAPNGFVAFHVRTHGDPIDYFSAVRTALLRVNPSIFLLAPTTLEEFASVPFYLSRSGFTVLSVLSAAALLLASIGLFTVVSYGVALRTKEVGIRMALGATRSAVTAMFLGGAMRLVAIGATIGLALALLLVALLRTLIPQLPSAGAAGLVAPVLILGFFAVIAGVVPARRAARLDPASTLRAD